jgi:hypothetical protein
LEEELDLQLAMLKQKQSDQVDSSLFPNKMEGLPHLKDNEAHSPILVKPSADQILAIEQSFFEENTLETTLFCLIMAALMIMPQL